MASARVIRLAFPIIVFAITSSVCAAAVSDFEDLALAPESYWNGSDESGGFQSGSAYYSNNYDTTFSSWDGFAYSNITDTTTSGMAGQYNAIVGSGEGSSSNYAVGYVGWAGPPTVTLDTAGVVDSLYVTNNNFAYYSMLNGDAFAKKFGGSSGGDEDWFLLTITGKDAGGGVIDTVDFYLADYRFANNSLDYILDTWEAVDLTSLGVVKSLEFTLSSSDVGGWGMNTPAYFAIDTVVLVFMVEIDIKPRSCPNPLNVKNKGVLPVVILGSEDFDVNTIDMASIRLAGVAPIRSSYEDAAAPVSDRQYECECTTEGGDGYLDLTLKFENEEIVKALGEVTDGEEWVLILTGALYDETPIEGADCILVISKKGKGRNE